MRVRVRCAARPCGREGELVAPGDWAALSNVLNLLARDPARRAALGAAAYERLARDFGADATLDLLEGRFRALLGPGTPASAIREVA